MLYSRDVPTGWIAIFRGGYELEVRLDRMRPEAVWVQSSRGASWLGAVGRGMTSKGTSGHSCS
jgi:hypothetical protein